MVYTLLFQASACSYEDIRLMASYLDDRDKDVKIHALNALKAFAGIRKFRIKIQVSVPVSALAPLGQKMAGASSTANCPAPRPDRACQRPRVPGQ